MNRQEILPPGADWPQTMAPDFYMLPALLAGPLECPDCHAVFSNGRWQWEKQVEALLHRCPACQRIADRFPAGYLDLTGSYLARNREDILALIQECGLQAQQSNPLHRIMDIEPQGTQLLVTTTEIELVRHLGTAVQHAHAGQLAFRYNSRRTLLRISWRR